MSQLARVTIDQSQFPDQVRLDLLQSLRSRQVNHKFHYDTVKQTHKWLALHEAYSPARTDPDCLHIYEQSFTDVAQTVAAASVHVIGLGCGGGQKDAALLKRLRKPNRRLGYTPCDVSLPMVLVARAAALREIDNEVCYPVVCDLATAQNLRETFRLSGAPFEDNQTHRLFTFFGMLPNFEPESILPKLAGTLERNDILLLSANLAPGQDYLRGVQTILPLYDNALTRDWLLSFLLDLGIQSTDGQVHFDIEPSLTPVSLLRIIAYFRFNTEQTVQLASDTFHFKPGEQIRLFFSYRHTPEGLSTLLAHYGLHVLEHWITRSGEEGVFRVRKLK